MARTMNETARRILQAASLRGSLDCVFNIELNVSDEAPIIGQSIEVSWCIDSESECNVNMSLLVNGVVKYDSLAPHGQMVIDILVEQQFEVQMVCEQTQSAIVSVTPEVVVPQITSFNICKGQRSINLNDEVTVEWLTADATRAKLIVDYGEPSMFEIELPAPEGTLTLNQLDLGDHNFRLQSFSIHEEVSERAFSELSRSLTIKEPIPELTNIVYSRNVDIQQKVEVRWQSQFSNEVILKWADGEEYLAVNGHISIKMNQVGEFPMTLTAVGDGGEVHKNLLINVTSLPIEIEFETTKTEIELGQCIEVKWRLLGAIEHAKIVLNEIEYHAIDTLAGSLTLTPIENSTLTLIAYCLDGSEHKQSISISIIPFQL